jgi:hypothetical protein
VLGTPSSPQQSFLLFLLVNCLFIVHLLLLFLPDVAGGAIVLSMVMYNNNSKEELEIMKTLHFIETLKLLTCI